MSIMVTAQGSDLSSQIRDFFTKYHYDELKPCRHPEFSIDCKKVFLNRADSEMQHVSDLLVGKTASHQEIDDLSLARREWLAQQLSSSQAFLR